MGKKKKIPIQTSHTKTNTPTLQTNKQTNKHTHTKPNTQLPTTEQVTGNRWTKRAKLMSPVHCNSNVLEKHERKNNETQVNTITYVWRVVN